MPHVAGHDVAKGADGKWIAAGGSRAKPVGFVERADGAEVGPAELGEFADQVFEGALIRMGIFDVAVLFEALDRRFVAARDAKDSICEMPLAVDQVAEDFLDRPFALLIGVRAARLVDLAEESRDIVDLVVEHIEQIRLRNLRYVVSVILVKFVGGGLFDHCKFACGLHSGILPEQFSRHPNY